MSNRESGVSGALRGEIIKRALMVLYAIGFITAGVWQWVASEPGVIVGKDIPAGVVLAVMTLVILTITGTGVILILRQIE